MFLKFNTLPVQNVTYNGTPVDGIAFNGLRWSSNKITATFLRTDIKDFSSNYGNFRSINHYHWALKPSSLGLPFGFTYTGSLKYIIGAHDHSRGGLRFYNDLEVTFYNQSKKVTALGKATFYRLDKAGNKVTIAVYPKIGASSVTGAKMRWGAENHRSNPYYQGYPLGRGVYNDSFYKVQRDATITEIHMEVEMD